MTGARIDRRLLILTIIGIAVFVVVRALFALKGTDMFGDTDDVMRLVTARDFLHGQGFNDPFQARDNTPFGSLMHWPRLVDALLAALMALAAPLGEAGAMSVAQIVWPSLLLIPLLALSYQLGRRYAGPGATLPSLVLPLLSLPVLTEFAPGRVDHHNVQMVLMAGLLLCLLRGRADWRAAAGAGLLSALSLTVGLETLPFVVLAIGVSALHLVSEPGQAAAPAGGFGAGLIVGSVVLFAATTRPQDFAVAACDVLSITYVLACVLAGAVLWIGAAVLPRLASWQQRLLVIGGLGLGVVLAQILLFPQCLAGPYAQLDPVLARTMFPHIPEAQSAWERFQDTPAIAIGLMLVPIVGLIIALWQAWRERGAVQVDWLVLLGFAVAAVAVSLVQVRGARLAAVFALPPCIWLTTVAWTQLKLRNDLRAALAVGGAWLLSAGIVQLSLAAPVPALIAQGGVATSEMSASVCVDRANYAELTKLPARRMLTQIEIGSAVLLFSRASVVATGYHRNSQGIADVNAFLGGSAGQAKAIAIKRGLDGVVLCRGVSATAALVARFASDPTWDWLTPVSAPDAPIVIYEISNVAR